MNKKVSFTDEELDEIKSIVLSWINEGFTTPPYDTIDYSIFEKLNISNENAESEEYYLQYNVSRPTSLILRGRKIKK